MDETPQAPEVAEPVEPFVGEFTLPSGATVTFADPEDLTGNDHRRIMKTMQGGDDPERFVGVAVDVMYVGAAMLISAWSVPYLPGAVAPAEDPAQLGRLKFRDYHAVFQAVAPSIAILFPGEATVDDAGVPGSPTKPASA